MHLCMWRTRYRYEKVNEKYSWLLLWPTHMIMSFMLGKTSGIKHVCERVIQDTEVDDDCRKPVLCYLNAVSIRSSQTPMESLFSELAFSAGFRTGNSAATVKNLLSRKPKKCIVLILDEIDALVSDVNSGGASSKSEQALQAILDCAANESYPLALIGISNTIGNDKFNRIRSMGKVCADVWFCN